MSRFLFSRRFSHSEVLTLIVMATLIDLHHYGWAVVAFFIGAGISVVGQLMTSAAGET